MSHGQSTTTENTEHAIGQFIAILFEIAKAIPRSGLKLIARSWRSRGEKLKSLIVRVLETGTTAKPFMRVSYLRHCGSRTQTSLRPGDEIFYSRVGISHPTKSRLKFARNNALLRGRNRVILLGNSDDDEALQIATVIANSHGFDLSDPEPTLAGWVVTVCES